MARSHPSHWVFPTPVSPAVIERLKNELAIGRVAAEILARRGLEDPAAALAYLDAEVTDPEDPFLLPELEAAAHRVQRAIVDGERIVVHGDYDADGISGTALLTGALRRVGAVAEPFVPDRVRDGYGVADRLVAHAAQADVKLIITVDTGSSAHEQLEQTLADGIDVIVCDHHLFDRRPDGATFFLNPHRLDSKYPNRDLCGCAVAYKLLQGLARIRDDIDLEVELDLVAIGLLGDQMNLHGENRSLVRRGLQRMTDNPRPGIMALLEVARLEGMKVEADDVAFQIAPRVNAAGRIEKALTALNLLLASNLAEARPLAQRIDVLNGERKLLDREVSLQASKDAAQLQRDTGAQGLVLASDQWHMGVVGIGAARVAEEFDVPTVLLSIEGDEARGSARSVPGFDLKAALDLCAEHLSRYGGHAAAAGMTLPVRNIPAFQASFDQAARELPRGAKQDSMSIDGRLALEEIDTDLAVFLQRLGPFGPGNRQPLFASCGVRRVGVPKWIGEDHVKLTLEEPPRNGRGPRQWKFVGFGMAEYYRSMGRGGHSLDIAYRIRYRKGSRFDPWELLIHTLRPAEQVSAAAD